LKNLRFLKGELLLHQIEVHTEDGTMRVRSLNFNPKAINDELASVLGKSDSGINKIPFQVVDANIAELVIQLSYHSMFTDNCHLVATGVKFSIIPSTNSPTATTSPSHHESEISTPKISIPRKSIHAPPDISSGEN